MKIIQILVNLLFYLKLMYYFVVGNSSMIFVQEKKKTMAISVEYLWIYKKIAIAVETYFS